MKLTPLVLYALIAAAPLAAQADPGYYVVTPYDNEGLRIVDFRYWSTHPQRGNRMVWPEIGFGYGVTSRWTTEIFWSGIGNSAGDVTTGSWNWQNQLLFTQGELPVDIAAHLQLVREPGGSRAFEFGPVVQTDLGRTQLNLNLIFDRPLGTDSSGRTRLKYQWQVRYRWLPPLHVGAQGFGELGTWNDWSPAAKQSHRVGPAVFLTFRDDDERAFKLQAAQLWGKTYGKVGRMFTMRAHMEF